MNLRQCLSTIACLLAAIVAGPSAAATAPLRIMTFNVRVPVDQGMNAWANRRAGYSAGPASSSSGSRSSRIRLRTSCVT